MKWTIKGETKPRLSLPHLQPCLLSYHELRTHHAKATVSSLRKLVLLETTKCHQDRHTAAAQL